MEWLQYYYTAKVVGIKSKRLGYLYYSVVLAILVYTLFSLLVHKQYIAFEGQLIGAVNMRLKYAQDCENSAFCNNQPPDRPCASLDKYESYSRAPGGKSLFIKTKVSEITEERVCARSGPGQCQPGQAMWRRSAKQTFYVAHVDDAVLTLGHSFRAPNFFEESGHSKAYSQDQREMAGVMFSSQADSKSTMVATFNRGEPYNSLRLADLLRALQINLDDEVEFNPKNQSYRRRGCTILLDLAYNNVRCDGSLSCMFGIVPTTFRIRPNVVPGEMLESEIISDSQNVRVRRVTHGIFITVEQSGKIGKFSIVVLFMTLLSGLGMITVATVVCDNIATYLDNRKDTFVTMKYAFESYKTENTSPKESEKGKEKVD